MKLLSVAIPCYNSESYMQHCIQTLMTGGEEVEILIVDDGSFKDRTAEIADRYAARYPSQIRAIHQVNGGHGQAVNTGLKYATGLYFKVVDSDDWVDAKALKQVLQTLREFAAGEQQLDMLVCNFVYDKQGAKRKKVMSYRTAMPVDEVFTWEDIRNFRLGQYILMHSVIYRTELLREAELVLPQHTFYVDNIFVYEPLPHVKNIYYMNVNLYRYFIGREDQSVNEKVMIGRIDQQYRVTELMLDYYNVYEIPQKKLRNYMINYLEVMMAICSILAILSEDEENRKKKAQLWKSLKEKDARLYRRLRWGLLGIFLNLPGKCGRRISVAGYHVAQKMFGFN